MTKILCQILALLFLASECHALTLSQLVKRVRQLTGDSPYYSTQPRLTDSAIKNLLNEGQGYFSAAWILTQRTSFDLAPGATEYILPLDYMATRRVQFKDKIIAEASLGGLDGEGRAWGNSGGTPNTYYTRTTTISVIGFVPWPTSIGTGTVTLDYYVQSGDMVHLGDKPFNGLPDFEPLHEALAKYAVYRFFLTIGNTTVADFYAKEVLSDIARLKAMVDSKPNYKPGISPAERR